METVSIIENLLGNLALSDYISAFIFAGLGLFLRHTMMVRKGIRKSSNTPNSFSWSYWFQNNFMTKITAILTTLITIFVTLRFSEEWFSTSVSMPFSFIIGLCFDYFFDVIKKMREKVSSNENN